MLYLISMRGNFIIFFTFIIILFSIDNVFCQTSSIPKLPVIDGKIHDEEWKDAKVFTEFYITQPKSDEKYYDSTVFYILQSKDAMYFALKFWPKGKVISKSLVRDRSFDEEN